MIPIQPHIKARRQAGFFHVRPCAHLISQPQVQSLPFQGRWLGEAETERSQQICDNLSVTFGDSSPGRGAFFFRCGGVKKGLPEAAPFPYHINTSGSRP